MEYKVGDKIKVEDEPDDFITEVKKITKHIDFDMIWFLDTEGDLYWLSSDDKSMSKIED